MASAHDRYLESRVLSADPLELVRLLYQGAIGAVREGRQFLEAGKPLERARAISRAMAILTELNSALDHERGGAIAGRLASLYDYMSRRLVEANVGQKDEPLAEVIGLLSTLLEGWSGLRCNEEKPMPAEAPWQQPPEPSTSYASSSWSL